MSMAPARSPLLRPAEAVNRKHRIRRRVQAATLLRRTRPSPAAMAAEAAPARRCRIRLRQPQRRKARVAPAGCTNSTTNWPTCSASFFDGVCDPYLRGANGV